MGTQQSNCKNVIDMQYEKFKNESSIGSTCILEDNELPIDEPSDMGKSDQDNGLPNYYAANPPSTPVTVPNAPTQNAVQANPRRSLFAFEEIYCTWFCFSLFTDGFANWSEKAELQTTIS